MQSSPPPERRAPSPERAALRTATRHRVPGSDDGTAQQQHHIVLDDMRPAALRDESYRPERLMQATAIPQRYQQLQPAPHALAPAPDMPGLRGSGSHFPPPPPSSRATGATASGGDNGVFAHDIYVEAVRSETAFLARCKAGPVTPEDRARLRAVAMTFVDPPAHPEPVADYIYDFVTTTVDRTVQPYLALAWACFLADALAADSSQAAIDALAKSVVVRGRAGNNHISEQTRQLALLYLTLRVSQREVIEEDKSATLPSVAVVKAFVANAKEKDVKQSRPVCPDRGLWDAMQSCLQQQKN